LLQKKVMDNLIDFNKSLIWHAESEDIVINWPMINNPVDSLIKEIRRDLYPQEFE